MPAIIRRNLLRRTVRRLRNSAEISAEQRRQVDRVWFSRDMMSMLGDKVDSVAANHSDTMLFAGGERPILDWLWAHRQEILEFIKTVIELFS